MVIASRQLIRVIKRDGPFATNEGSAATYTVALQSAPSEPVLVKLETADNFAELSATHFAFDVANWSQPQTLTVSGARDNMIRESPYVAMIRLSTESDDVEFAPFNGAAGIKPVSFGVLIADSDTGTFGAHLFLEQG